MRGKTPAQAELGPGTLPIFPALFASAHEQRNRNAYGGFLLPKEFVVVSGACCARTLNRMEELFLVTILTMYLPLRRGRYWNCDLARNTRN